MIQHSNKKKIKIVKNQNNSEPILINKNNKNIFKTIKFNS